jgi:hypothetical protein
LFVGGRADVGDARLGNAAMPISDGRRDGGRSMQSLDKRGIDDESPRHSPRRQTIEQSGNRRQQSPGRVGRERFRGGALQESPMRLRGLAEEFFGFALVVARLAKESDDQSVAL